MYALASNGLPLSVAVYGAAGAPVVSTTMLDVSTSAPTAA